MSLGDVHSVTYYEGKGKNAPKKVVPCSCPFPWGHELPQSPAPPGYSYVSPSIRLSFLYLTRISLLQAAGRSRA